MLDVTCVVPSPIKGQSYDVTHDGSGWRKDVVNQSWEFGFLPPYTSSPRWPLGAAEVYLFPPPPKPCPQLGQVLAVEEHTKGGRGQAVALIIETPQVLCQVKVKYWLATRCCRQ